MDPSTDLLLLFEAILLPFVEQVRFRASQVHNLRTAVSLEGRKAKGE